MRAVFIGRHEGPVGALAFAGNGSLAFAGDVAAEPMIRLWDLRTRTCVRSFRAPGGVTKLLVTEDGKRLVVLGSSSIRRTRFVSVIDARDGRELRLICERDSVVGFEGIWALAGDRLLVSHSDRGAHSGASLWDLGSGRRLRWYSRPLDDFASGPQRAMAKVCSGT